MQINKGRFDTVMLQKLTVVAKEFMDTMARKVKEKGLPKAIIEYTSADSPKKEGNKYSVDVVIDTSENAAPMAGAFEWGSGEHGEKGKRYPIVARNPEEQPLHFFWVEQDRWFKGPIVRHPGVEARPYIKPSIEESKEKIRKILGKEFKAIILADTKRIEVISAKK